MINRTRQLFYEVKGVFYKDLAEAQKADLGALIPETFFADLGTHPSDTLTDWLLKNAEAIATILRTTPRSRRRKPRADKGVPRKKNQPVAETSK
jgi:hypothetical protein